MTDAPSKWFNRRVRDNQGGLIGVVVDVFDDATSSRPAWLAIRTGFFGTRVVLAPLKGASLFGDDVVIAHRSETISGAPSVDIVDPGQRQRLIDHYASSHRAAPAGSPLPTRESSS